LVEVNGDRVVGKTSDATLGSIAERGGLNFGARC
jgi:hypothetical protein